MSAIAHADNDADARDDADASASIDIELGYRAPLDWPRLFGFLRARAITGVERVDGEHYQRTVSLACGARSARRVFGWLSLRAGESATGQSVARVNMSASLAPVKSLVATRLRALFDLDCPIAEVDAALGPLARARPGLRLPGAFDGFELAVRAVLGQQISVKAARTLAGRFAERYGEPLATPIPGLARAFPDATRIAGDSVDAIAGLGMIASRARTILAIARASAGGGLSLTPDADTRRTVEALRALPGIGEWTAAYIAMRALGDGDAFPAGDLVVRRALGLTRPREVIDRARVWCPWRGYAVMHLWAGEAERVPDRKGT